MPDAQAVWRTLPMTRSAFLIAAMAALGVSSADSSAQTIRGRLLDVQTGQPIDLGLVVLLTEAGDSITSTVTSPSGLFSLTSSEPGSFVLLASAWGYRETAEGVFELGEGGEMSVDFRISPEPLPIDELLVGVARPVFDHQLVRNGFVRRFQRGLGHFITPHDIERSPARATEALLEGIPGMVVRPVTIGDSGPLGYLGDQVQMRSATSGLCTPSVFVDGIRSGISHRAGTQPSRCPRWCRSRA